MKNLFSYLNALDKEMMQIVHDADKIPLTELEARVAHLEEGIDTAKATNVSRHEANTANYAQLGARIEAMKADILKEAPNQHQTKRHELKHLIALYEKEKEILWIDDQKNKAYVALTDELKSSIRAFLAEKRDGL